jgi:hypothetical protein
MSYFSNKNNPQYTQEYKGRNDEAEENGSRRKQPKVNEWVGDYVMKEEKTSPYKQKTLHELAQSNSYTYTLSNPMN